MRSLLESDLVAGRLTKRRLEAARYVWRAGATDVGAWIDRAVIEKLHWPISGEDPVALVAMSAVRAAAVRDVGPAQRDFSGWHDGANRYMQGLVEGPFGLRAWAGGAPSMTSCSAGRHRRFRHASGASPLASFNDVATRRPIRSPSSRSRHGCAPFSTWPVTRVASEVSTRRLASTGCRRPR